MPRLDLVAQGESGIDLALPATVRPFGIEFGVDLDAEEELPSGRRSLYLIKNVFDKDLREFSDFGGLRIGYNGLGYIRVAELATTD